MQQHSSRQIQVCFSYEIIAKCIFLQELTGNILDVSANEVGWYRRGPRTPGAADCVDGVIAGLSLLFLHQQHNLAF